MSTNKHRAAATATAGHAGGVKRAVRVAGRLQQELARCMRDLHDPRVLGALISRVEVTDDLQLAKVYIRHELGGVDVKALIKGLESATGKLRKDLAAALDLRYAPNLRFYYDEGQDAALRIEQLIQEVKREAKG
ncbi:MAG: 30S ribosome-binding factor RbfA [Minicystis sp.]